MTRLRVLHVSAYFAPAFVYGGPPRSIHALCKALDTAGVDVDVLTTTANGDREPLPAATVAARAVDGVNARFFPLGTPAWFWRSPGLNVALDNRLADYDVLHIHGLWHAPGWHAAAAARRMGMPYLISPRGMLEREALSIHRVRKAIALGAIERRNLRGAACLHATSMREAVTIESRRFGPPVVIAPNGVDSETVVCDDPGPLLQRLGVDPASRFVLYLGRIHAIKRLDLIAGAAARLRARDVVVVIAGPDDKGHRSAIAPVFDQLGLKTCWTGPVDGAEKAALLTAARALVLCSDSESFGMSVAEAMAAGVPVVATRGCPWQDVALAGAGYWVPQTAEAIAQALDEILSDDGRARAMGARGRALVGERYTWRASAAVLANEYQRLAETRRESRVA